MGISGALCFALFFVTVMDCVFIDNALKQIPDDKFFLHFMSSQRTLLRAPGRSFVAGVLCVFVNFLTGLQILYGLNTCLVATATCALSLTGIGIRWRLLAGLMDSYAHGNKEQVAMAMAGRAKVAPDPSESVKETG